MHAVGRVRLFEIEAGEDFAILELEGTDIALRLSKEHPRFAVWSRLINERRPEGFFYVEFDLPSRIVQAIYTPYRRRIESIGKQPEEGRLKIILLRAPSLYFVKTDRSDYGSMRQLLEEALRDKEEILVTVHPTTLEILDVRP